MSSFSSSSSSSITPQTLAPETETLASEVIPTCDVCRELVPGGDKAYILHRENCEKLKKMKLNPHSGGGASGQRLRNKVMAREAQRDRDELMATEAQRLRDELMATEAQRLRDELMAREAQAAFNAPVAANPVSAESPVAVGSGKKLRRARKKARKKAAKAAMNGGGDGEFEGEGDGEFEGEGAGDGEFEGEGDGEFEGAGDGVVRFH